MMINIWLPIFRFPKSAGKASELRWGNLHALTSGGLHVAVLLEADGRHGNETGGLGGGEVTNLVHAGLGHVVQLLGLGGAAQNGDATLVGTAADLAVDGLLRGSDGGLEELTLGGEVQTVVQELRIR